jgi:SAM-dependent methyltransferase
MKNLINEIPSKSDVHGRSKYSIDFVDEVDLKGKKVLDIGCGYGWYELILMSRGATAVCGIEISENDLVTAKKYINDKNVEFKVGSAIEIPYGNDTFDSVVSWEVIEHIPKDTENKMFEEVYRVLKPGGVFYLSTPYRSLVSMVLDPAWWILGHRHYSKVQLKRFGVNNGFQLQDIKVKGAFWNIFSILTMYIFKWIFRTRFPFEAYVNERLDTEYISDKGYVDVFAKYKKL